MAFNNTTICVHVDNKTLIRVALDGEDEHLKLGDNGIYFDGDFGLI